MAAGRMTQTQLVQHLAKRCAVNNKVARSFLDELANVAIKVAMREAKERGISRVSGSGLLGIKASNFLGIKASGKARMGRLATGVAIRGRAQNAIPGKDPGLEVLKEVFSRLYR